MKRFHVHVAVADLEQSVRFYSQLFASEPAVIKPDYAKWMLDDPRINFAISRRGDNVGVNHLGMQVDSGEELELVHSRLEQAEGSITAEGDVTCCYARSNKYWITDPQGVAWETFHSLGSVPFYGASEAEPAVAATGCCVARTEAVDSMVAPLAAKSCCSPASVASESKACC